MKVNLSLPEWYPLEEYTHEITPENALKKVHKRVTLDKLLKNLKNQSEFDELFNKIIIKNEVPDITLALFDNPPKAIKPLSITEAYMIVGMLVHNHEFRNQPNIVEFEDAIMKASRSEPLNDTQKSVLQHYREIPWHHFQPDNNTLIPLLPCSIGIPVTINPFISRSDSLFEIKKFYNTHQKPKTRNISQEILNEWKAKKIFELYDLQLWFNIKKIKYKKIHLIKKLWNNSLPPSKKIEDISVEDKALLKEVLKLSKKAINEFTLKTLFYECSKRKTLIPNLSTG